MQYLTKNKNILVLAFFLFFLILIYFGLLPNFYNLIQPDSYSYINGSDKQKHLYTVIIKTFSNIDGNFNYLISFQKLFLISSILFLFIFLSKSNLFLASLFLILLVCNISYISYSKVILTESIFFSFLNFFLGFILFYEKTKKEILIYLACFCLGGLYAIKSIGFIITIPFFLITCFCYNKKKRILISILFLCLLPLIESFHYYALSENKSRTSVLQNAFLGKIFVVSGVDNNTILTNKEEIFLKNIVRKSQKVHKHLDTISNPIKKNIFLQNYEVYGQFNLNKKKELNSEEIRELLFKLILNNKLHYLQLSINNYIFSWIPLGVMSQKYLINELKGVPIENLTFGGKGLNLSYLLTNFIMISFVVLFFIFHLLILISLKRFIFRKHNILDLVLLTTPIYMLTYSVLNVGAFRFFLPVYPLVLLGIIYEIIKILRLKTV